MVFNKIIGFCVILTCGMTADVRAMYAKISVSQRETITAMAAGSTFKVIFKKNEPIEAPFFLDGLKPLIDIIAHAKLAKKCEPGTDSYWLNLSNTISESKEMDYNYQIAFLNREKEKEAKKVLEKYQFMTQAIVPIKTGLHANPPLVLTIVSKDQTNK